MRRDDRLFQLDLSTLAILRDLLETQSVTLTARRLGSTQPNVSRALSKLRTVFDDELLVPAGRGLTCTHRGRELLPRLDAMLADARGLLSPPTPTSPAKETRTVRIAAADYAIAVLLDRWIARVRKEAPGVTVEIDTIVVDSIDALARGEIDLAIARREPISGIDQFVMKQALSDRWVCAVRPGHPRARRKLTLAQYLALEHVMISVRLPAISPVEAALHRLGKERKVVARVPTFMSALALVKTTDIAVAAPERLVRTQMPDAECLSLPFPIEPTVLNLFWHPRRTTDPFHRWVREGILPEDALPAR
ncbi:MAG: LysR family transcriptional regulator [Polyangiaceae bacterium]|nr:LysR family transcriptional regulator [Polyangiaceae bacterium]